MNPDRLQTDVNDLRDRVRKQGGANLLLSAAVVLALVVILNIVGMERTVVSPPTIEKTFWVSRDKASASYLEQMTGYVSWLVLDVAPESIEWKRDVLLTFVDPSTTGALKNQQELEATRLKRMNASTYFLPVQFASDEKEQAVIIRGKLRTQINGADTSVQDKAYVAKFRFSYGRVHLMTFKEVKYDVQSPTQALAFLSDGAK